MSLTSRRYRIYPLSWIRFLLFHAFFSFFLFLAEGFIPLMLFGIVIICPRGLFVGYGALNLERVQYCPDG